jgi:pyrimidine operon attenuation protein/uracil phosphoribosyltransferase
MSHKKVLILDTNEINQKTKRIAYQLLEQNDTVKELILIGIQPNGYKYAQQLQNEIEAIDGVKVTLLSLTMNKKEPNGREINLETGKLNLDQKTVVLVDDVANTGKTLYYALKPIMNFTPAKVQAVALVDRQHKLFPVSPDIVGLSLSTTLQEHIAVEYDSKGNGKAYLV